MLTPDSLKMLEKELAKMKPRQRLFEIVKAEMQKRGHWKQLPRGDGGKALNKRS